MGRIFFGLWSEVFDSVYDVFQQGAGSPLRRTTHYEELLRLEERRHTVERDDREFRIRQPGQDIVVRANYSPDDIFNDGSVQCFEDALGCC